MMSSRRSKSPLYGLGAGWRRAGGGRESGAGSALRSAAGAIVLRVVLIFFALQLLALPFLKVVGAFLLIWIGIKLLQPEEGEHTIVHGSATLIGAIKTIVVADTVMPRQRHCGGRCCEGRSWLGCVWNLH